MRHAKFTFMFLLLIVLPYAGQAQNFYGNSSSPPPADHALLGFPPPVFAPPDSPVDLPLLFFEQVPADSQVSSISATVKVQSNLFEFDATIDTMQTALQGWDFVVSSSKDSVRFVATAPAGVFFVHSDSMPVPLVRFLGQIAPEAADGDSIEFKLRNVAIVSKGNAIAFADSIFAPGVIFVGQGGPGQGPENELFAFSDTMAAPGANIPIHLSLINPVPVDSQLSRIRGVIRAMPPELQWDSTGAIVSTALANWSLAVNAEGDSLIFDAIAPPNTYLAHDSAETLRLFTFGATIRPSAPPNMPISTIASQLYLTLHNSEKAFGPMMVRPGHVFVQPDFGGQPFSPSTASADGRTNLGLYGGYALDMVYDEVNDVMLAAVAAPQSVFMSTDSGLTWRAAFPTDSLEYVTDNVTRGFGGRGMTVEASQGYCYSRTSQEAGTLAGAQVTEDGENWRTLLDAYLIRELIQDRYPGAHDGPRAVNCLSASGPTALVASENFVFRTTDAGQTWSISIVPDTSALNAMASVNLLSLRRNDASGNSFYTVLGGDPFDPVGRLFRTADGVNFTPLYIVSGSDTAKVIVDVLSHPANSDTLWISTADMGSGLNGLWRSYDAGDTWEHLSLSANPGMGVRLKLYQEATLPGTDNIRLVAVGSNQYSDDLGDNWTDFSPSDDPFVDRVSSANAGLGHIPNTDIYFGQGDASPSRSINGLGGTYYFVPTGIEGITIWKIAQIPNEPDKVYLATSAGLAYTSHFTDTTIVSTAKWASPYGNYPINPVGGGNLEFTAIAIDPNNTSHIVAANGNALFVTTNGGFTNQDWSSIAYHEVTGLDEQKFKSSGGRVSAFAFLNSDSIFAAAYCENVVYGALLLSEDGGNSWKTLPQAGDHVFKAIIVAKTGVPNSEVLFASGGGVSDDPGGHATQIDTGAVYKSLDRGATWSRTSYGPQAVFNPAPFPLPVNDIVAKPNSVDTLYLACGENLSNAIAYSYDGGSTLHTISMQAIGAREGAFEAVAINKHHPDSIYFAIRRDILVYDALLDSATTLFRGYPGELTHALLYDDLTMGSSAGFFEITAPSNTPTTAIDDHAPQQPLQMKLTQNYPNPFNPSTRIVFTLSQQSKVKLEVFNLLGQRVALLLSKNLAAGKHEVLWKPTKLTSGVYFYRLQATEKTGRTTAITKKLMLVR